MLPSLNACLATELMQMIHLGEDVSTWGPHGGPFSVSTPKPASSNPGALIHMQPAQGSKWTWLSNPSQLLLALCTWVMLLLVPQSPGLWNGDIPKSASWGLPRMDGDSVLPPPHPWCLRDRSLGCGIPEGAGVHPTRL